MKHCEKNYAWMIRLTKTFFPKNFVLLFHGLSLLVLVLLVIVIKTGIKN